MLQAHVDDTKSERQPPFFILAGHLQTAEVWTDFSNAWQEELDREPKIGVFKLKDIWRKPPVGPFNGWTAAACEERIAKFRALIERFELCEFGIGFRTDEYEEIFAGVHRRAQRSPYYFAAGALSRGIAHMIEPMGFPRQPVEIIFDMQVMEKAFVLQGWEEAQKIKEPGGDLEDILCVPPRWDTDSRLRPLQAADMHATWVRIRAEHEFAGKPPPGIPGFTKRSPGMFMPYTREYLLRDAQNLFSGVAEMRRRLNAMPGPVSS
jgi:hypothetical protein